MAFRPAAMQKPEHYLVGTGRAGGPRQTGLFPFWTAGAHFLLDAMKNGIERKRQLCEKLAVAWWTCNHCLLHYRRPIGNPRREVVLQGWSISDRGAQAEFAGLNSLRLPGMQTMFTVPLKHTTTWQHTSDERMSLLILKYVNQGMDGVTANDKARFEAKVYAKDVVRPILDAEEERQQAPDMAGRVAT